MKKEEKIGGTTLEIFYDGEIKKLNLELVKAKLSSKVTEDTGYFEIHLQDWTKKDKSKTLIKLHIKEAIELKSIIDNLVYDSLAYNGG